MCQEKKADAPTAEIVNDLSLEKEVLDVTYNENKVVKHEKGLIVQELEDPESDKDDLDIETEMDRTKPNSHTGHGDLVGEARGHRHPRCCTTEHRTCHHISSLLTK